MDKVKISNRDMQELSEIETPEFPKYTTQIINLANQNAQGTRPAIVGQQSELIQQFSGNTAQGWKIWYETQYPDAIAEATDKISHGVENLRNAINPKKACRIKRNNLSIGNSRGRSKGNRWVCRRNRNFYQT
jgi:hypothetical protein